MEWTVEHLWCLKLAFLLENYFVFAFFAKQFLWYFAVCLNLSFHTKKKLNTAIISIIESINFITN